MQKTKRIWLHALLVPLLAGLPAACDDNPTEPDEHADEVAEIRLQIGDQTVRIIDGTPDGPILFGVGVTPIEATFHAADGDEIEVHDDEFELRVTITDALIAAFARTGAFEGTLTGVAAGTTTAQVSLYHLIEAHADVGPWTVSIEVQ